MSKFENPVRLIELSPKKTLIDTGLGSGDVFCDIGAGTGIFTIEAAAITGAKTYAIDTSDEMLLAIDAKAKALFIDNIELINPSGYDYPIDSGSCDYVMMCSVLHEITEKQQLFDEIHRILKEDGSMVIIEFHKKQTPMGPPENQRLSIDSVKETAEQNGFVENRRKDLGENFYLSVFNKKADVPAKE